MLGFGALHQGFTKAGVYDNPTVEPPKVESEKLGNNERSE